jgi:hypothetical protein
VLKQILVILLFVGFLGQTFSKCFIFLDYQLNKDFIAANLCENRDKPAMKCAGKCYLCKRLKKEDKKDQETPGRRLDNKLQSIPFRLGFELYQPDFTINIVKYPYFQEFVRNYFIISIFHPPQC